MNPRPTPRRWPTRLALLAAFLIAVTALREVAFARNRSVATRPPAPDATGTRPSAT